MKIERTCCFQMFPNSPRGVIYKKNLLNRKFAFKHIIKKLLVNNLCHNTVLEDSVRTRNYK